MNQATNVNIVPSYGQRGDLHFSQYDVGRTATINLYAVNEAYTIPVGATVKIQATKPSGLGFDVACTFGGSVVTVVSTETMTEEAGRFPCELRITKDSDVIGTANFMFVVEPSPHPDGTVDGDAEEVINEIKALVLQSEGWALGTQDGVPVDSSSPYYHNNSKWWSEHPVGGGISDAVKLAILDCFENVVWINGDGQDYYDTLFNAFYPPANLVSISAVYTQMGTVYDNQSLDSLKSNLVVTALYDDTTSATVPSTDYTLSGSLTTGTSTITVIYEDKTTTFDVTVTHAVTQYTITNTLTECTNSNTASVINELTEYTGTLTANQGYIMSSVTITMGSTDITSTAYDSSDGSITIASVTGNIVITAEAIVDVGWISGVPYEYSKIAGEGLGTSGPFSRGDYTRTDVLPMAGATYITIVGSGGVTAYFYRDEYSANYNASVSANSSVKYTVGLHFTQFACTKQTNSFPSSLVLTPYKCDEIGEDTVWVSNKEYEMPYPASVVNGTSTDGSYYSTLYFNCVASTNINFFGLVNTDANASVYFYDSSKTQIGSAVSLGYTAVDTSKDITVPEGAYYFKVSAKFKKNGRAVVVTLT